VDIARRSISWLVCGNVCSHERLFGGHREGGESYLECVVREIKEEISYSVPAARFTFLTSYVEPNADGHGARGYGESHFP
jgi:8-oxo-dGTP pyrophosphatase MutT (NUDIX family)